MSVFVCLFFLSSIFQNHVFFFKQYTDHIPLLSENPQQLIMSVKRLDLHHKVPIPTYFLSCSLYSTHLS